MRLEQLRIIVTIVRSGLSVSRAAEALNMPQPAVSRQLRSLERELGVDVFARKQKRLRGLTRPGQAIVDVALRMLQDADTLTKISRDFVDEDSGTLTVATTHTQARYALPSIAEEFLQRYPKVRLMLRQGTPAEVNQLVSSGEADLCIGSEFSEEELGLVLFECYSMNRIVLTPRNHPLLKVRKLTLEKLARYPIITYDAPFIGRSRIVKAFAARGLSPDIVLSSIDSDVIKAYVERGMGIAIVATLAYDTSRDTRLRAMDASHLFEPNIIYLGVRRNDYLRAYVYDFIRMFASHLDRKTVEVGMQAAAQTGKR
ncbi:MAG: CysB family HTH-type transcriptional regulator [Betaproteobacteria bacterium]|nr:CysB family HTH-type transcriptional regulator [Betaproteobacteria bacterium]